MSPRILSLVLLAACGPRLVEPTPGAPSDVGRFVASESETDLVLLAANTLSLEALDDDVALDARAARGIVDARPFDDLATLDAVPYVGNSALGKLLAYAQEHLSDDEPTGELVHGVEEGSFAAEVLLDFVNAADQDVLDDDVGLDRRAAQSIVDDRPFTTLQALDDAAYVGASAFADLVEHLDLGSDCPVGGVFSNGDAYGSLADALVYGATGATVDLCPGEHQVPSTIDRNVTLRGTLDSVLVGTTFLEAEEVRSEGITLRLASLRVRRGNSFFVDGGELVDGTYVVEETARLELDDVVALGAFFSVSGIMDITDTVLDGNGEAHNGVELHGGDLYMSGGALYRYGWRGLKITRGATELFGVDFGRGATENDVADIELANGDQLTWLHDDIWLICSQYECFDRSDLRP